MSHKPDNLRPEQRIILDVDNFEDDVLRRIFSSDELCHYVRGLKFSQRTLNDDVKAQDLFRHCYERFEIIADLQLAGGFDDMVERLRRADQRYHPSAVTVAAGVTFDATRHLNKHLADEKDAPDIFLTAVLPEVSEVGCSGEFKRSPEDYTEDRGQWAAQLSLRGIYGAARHAVQIKGIEYMGSGISLDGEDYVTRSGVRKLAMKAGGAIVHGCDLIVVGHAVADAEDPFEALNQVGGEVALALNGSSHPDLKGK